MLLTGIGELVELEEVLNVLVQRNLFAKTVVFRRQEKSHDNILGGVAVDIHSYAEDLVVQTRVLYDHALVVENSIA